jgi:hypothetical protein
MSYQALISAASALIGTDLLKDVDQVPAAEAETFIDRNREHLESARHALSQRCSIPLMDEAPTFPERCGDIWTLRNLAYAFRLELRLALSRSKFDQTAQIAIDVLELSNVFRRGGSIIDFLAGIAVQDLAVYELRQFRLRMDEPTRAKVIQAIDRIEREQESFDMIAERDRKWEIAANLQDESCHLPEPEPCDNSDVDGEAQQVIRAYVQTLIDLPREQKNSVHASLEVKYKALVRMLGLDLAIRSYHQARASYPDDLASLIPGNVAQLPLDPFSNQSFVYRKQPDGFLLYSPGPCQVDHGGVFGHWLLVASGRADFCLDAGDYAFDCCSINAKRSGLLSRVVGSIRTAWNVVRGHRRFTC